MCVQCCLCAYNPIFVRIVLFMYSQRYLCAHSLICVLTVLFTCVQCYLCAYNAIYLDVVPFVSVQCYLCAHSAICMLTVLLTCLVCMQWYLCGYGDIFTYMNGFLYVEKVLFMCLQSYFCVHNATYMSIVLFRYAQCYLCPYSAIYVRKVPFVCVQYCS